MSIKHVRLNNNKDVPSMAFGTGTAWYKKDGNEINAQLVEIIKEALKLGFFHLDCAEMYGTDKEVALAIKESGIPREQLFVTTKVWSNIRDPIKSLEESLSRLELDYVDLYLIHAPFFNQSSHGITLKDAWKALETLVDSGKAKSIGVSNFRVNDLKELLSFARIKPVVNQIEFHPYLLSSSSKIVEYSLQNDILIESYGPLASIVYHPNGPVDSVVADIASRLQKTPAQVLLKWNQEKTKGVVITTSSKAERLKEHLGLFSNCKLTEDDIKRIDEAGLSTSFRKFWADEDWS